MKPLFLFLASVSLWAQTDLPGPVRSLPLPDHSAGTAIAAFEKTNQFASGFLANDSITADLLWRLPAADASGCWTSDGAKHLSIGSCAGLPALDTTIITQNATDPTKQMRFDDSGISASSTRVLKVQDFNYTIAGIDHTETFTADQTFNANILTGGGYNIGSSSQFFTTIYGNQVVATDFQITDSTSFTHVYHLGEDSSHNFALTSGLYQIANWTTVLGAGTMTMFGGIQPDSSGSGNLGQPSLPWATTYTNNLRITGITGSTRCLQINSSGDVGAFSTDCASLPVPDTTIITQNASDATKQMRFDDSGISTSNTRVLKVQDFNYALAAIDHTQTFTADQTFNANILTGGGYNIGSSSQFFTTIYGNQVVATDLEITDSTAFTHVFHLGEDSSHNFALTSGLYQIANWNTVLGAGTMTMFGGIQPNSSGAGNLGTASLPWATTYTNNLRIEGITGSTQCLHVDSSGNVSGAAADCNGGVTSISPGSLTGAVTLAGTTNEITLTQSGSTITFATPQAINTLADVNFHSVTLGSGVVVNATSGTAISQNNFGTKFSVDYQGNMSTGTITPRTNAGFDLGSTSFHWNNGYINNLTVTSCTGCGGVTSLSPGSLTGAVTLAGTTNEITLTQSGSTITFATPQAINTLADVNFHSVTLGSGVIVNATSGTAISQNNFGTKFSVDYQGNVVMTGLTTGSSSNATIYIGSGNFYLRQPGASSGISCSGVTDGWSAVTSDDYFVTCIGSGRFRAALASY